MRQTEGVQVGNPYFLSVKTSVETEDSCVGSPGRPTGEVVGGHTVVGRPQMKVAVLGEGVGDHSETRNLSEVPPHGKDVIIFQKTFGDTCSQ